MAKESLSRTIKQRIKVFPDFPKPGVLFKDIFSLFTKPNLLEDIVNDFYNYINENHKSKTIDAVIALDARGFLFGPLLALKLNCSFVPLRKKGKLPGEVIHDNYLLEYGEASIEMQVGIIKENDNVVIVDDLLATGGTMASACNLMQLCKANILECLFVVELTGLNGIKKLPDCVSVYSIVQFDF